MNARSVKNKAEIICEFVVENDADVVVVTETWLGAGDRDKIIRGNLTPTGYSLLDVPR